MLDRAADTAIERLRAAGAIIMGELAMQELSLSSPSFDLPFPPTRNPRNPAHKPGSPSSGSAVAVAAGLMPGAIGSATAGSTRKPAENYGMIGLKPSFGLVSCFGHPARAAARPPRAAHARTDGRSPPVS